jgi:ribosomal protein S18 acetylase RimI-like enzyme
VETVRIRTATMADYEAICRLEEELDSHHVRILPEVFQPFPGPARPRDLVAEYVEAEDADYLLAEVGSAVVGLLNLKKATHPSYPMFKRCEYAMIVNLVVDPAYRKQGVAAALIQEAGRWARHRGLRRMHATVWAANAEAMNLFKKQGFQTLSERLQIVLE